jgi:exosortase
VAVKDRSWLPAAACAAAAFAVFQFWGNATRGYIATNSLFYWWGFQWVNADSETEHAWLVLGLSVFLFARNLRRRGADGAPATRAAAASVAVGLLLHALGYVAQQPRLSIVGFLVVLWGILALAGGRRWAASASFPVAFMVFAIPVNALDTVGFWLRMMVVRTGAGIAHLFGIAVIRNGTQLVAPDGRYHYDVVAACSGVRSLMALSALSLFIAYLWLRPAWLRAFILLVSLPLVYAGNVLRITSIILAAQWGGQVWGDRVHDAMGFGVFIVVLGGVLWIADAASRLRPEWGVAAAEPKAPAASGVGPSAWKAAAAGIILSALTAGFLAHRSSLPLREKAGVLVAADGANPVELPAFLGSDWMGRSIQPTQVEREILPPDTGYSRKLYMSTEGPNEQVLLSIVLSGRDRTSIHRPELCLVGQGWTLEGSSTHRFSYPGGSGASFEATVLQVRRNEPGLGPVPELVAYWFVGGDQVVPSMAQRMACDAWNRVVHGRADRWAYVLLQTGAHDGEAAALARMQSVLDSTLPAFQPAGPLVATTALR